MTDVLIYDTLGELTQDSDDGSGVGYTIDQNGFLRFRMRIARTGVLMYSDADGNTWGELRLPDEVFDADSMRSFEMAVVTLEHPRTPVSPENVRRVQVGQAGSDVRRDGIYLESSGLITDRKVIEGIENGDRWQVSAGYRIKRTPRSGVHNGLRYDFVHERIRANHIALVRLGRSGPGVRQLIDHLQGPTRMDQANKTDMIEIGDRQYDVPDEVATHVAALKAENAELREKAAAAAPAEDMAEGEKEAQDMPDEEKAQDMGDGDGDGDKAQDSIRADELERRVDSLVADRLGLIRLADRFNVDSPEALSGSDIRLAIIRKAQPAMAELAESRRDDASYLEALCDSAVSIADSRPKQIREAQSVLTGATIKTDDLSASLDAYADRMSGRVAK